MPQMPDLSSNTPLSSSATPSTLISGGASSSQRPNSPPLLPPLGSRKHEPVTLRDSIVLGDTDSWVVEQATSVPISTNTGSQGYKSPSLVSTVNRRPSNEPSTKKPFLLDESSQPPTTSEPFLVLPSQTLRGLRQHYLDDDDQNQESAVMTPENRSRSSSIVHSPIAEVAQSDSNIEPDLSNLKISEPTPHLNASNNPSPIASPKLEVHENVSHGSHPYTYLTKSDAVSLPVKEEPVDTSLALTASQFDSYMEDITKRAQKLNSEISDSQPVSLKTTPSPSAPESFTGTAPLDAQDPKIDTSGMADELHSATQHKVQAPLNDSLIYSEAKETSQEAPYQQGNFDDAHMDDSFDEDIYGYYADSANDDDDNEDLFKSSLDDPAFQPSTTQPAATPVTSLPGSEPVVNIKSSSPLMSDSAIPAELNRPISTSTVVVQPSSGTYATGLSNTVSPVNDSSSESFEASSAPLGSKSPQVSSNMPESRASQVSLANSYSKSPQLSSSSLVSKSSQVSPVNFDVKSSQESTNSSRSKSSEPSVAPVGSSANDSLSKSQPPSFQQPEVKITSPGGYGRWRPISTTPEAESSAPATATSDGNADKSVDRSFIPSIQVDAPNQSPNAIDEAADEGLTPTNQTALEKDIMKSFGSSRHVTPAPIVAPVPQTHAENFRTISDYRAPNSPAVPDPEIAALYRSTSHFLNRPISQIVDDFPTTQPLSPQRSREQPQSLMGVIEGDTPEVVDREYESNDIKPTTSASSWESQSVSHTLENDNEDKSISIQKNPSRTIPEKSPSASSLSDMSPVTSRTESKTDDKSVKYKSLILEDDDLLSRSLSHGSATSAGPSKYDYLARHGTTATTIVTPNTVKAAVDKLNKPPEFDFRAILTKPRSEDRKKAFDQARTMEVSYDCGLDTWLHQISSQADFKTLQSNGVVTNRPTHTHKPIQKTPSSFSTSLKPSGLKASAIVPSALKQGIAGKLSISKVGEKSSHAAKGFFARGKKLIKSDK